MKTLRITEETHKRLTATLGTIMAQTGKMKTYEDTINTILNQSVILPPELLAEIEKFIAENKRLGFTTREDFIRDAARCGLKFLNENSEYVKIPRDKYKKLEAAVKEMNTPYRGALDLIHSQIDEVLEKYDCWLKEKEVHEKALRRKR